MDPSIRQQRERERRARLAAEQARRDRIASAKLFAQAEQQRIKDMLMAVQRWNYPANLQKLIALNRIIIGD